MAGSMTAMTATPPSTPSAPSTDSNDAAALLRARGYVLLAERYADEVVRAHRAAIEFLKKLPEPPDASVEPVHTYQPRRDDA